MPAGNCSMHRSKRNKAYDAKETRRRWEHYSKSPPDKIGAGTIFHLAAEARHKGTAPPPGRILTGDAFISSFVPPDWLIDGIVQRGRLYACTSLTGHGKTAVWGFNACMVQAGRMVGNLDVAEATSSTSRREPEDLKARLHGMAAAFKLQPALLPSPAR